MNKLIIDWYKFNNFINILTREITLSGWRPDYIVGINRGGLIPAVMLSHYFKIPMKTLMVSLRDSGECVSDCGMAEDALGYPKQERFVADENNIEKVLEAASGLLVRSAPYKNILIVDDINDTGATFNWIMNDWKTSCLPNDEDWKWVWNNNVRFAVLVDNLASKCDIKVDYKALEINKAENNVLVDFPYESWWER